MSEPAPSTGDLRTYFTSLGGEPRTRAVAQCQGQQGALPVLRGVQQLLLLVEPFGPCAEGCPLIQSRADTWTGRA